MGVCCLSPSPSPFPSPMWCHNIVRPSVHHKPQQQTPPKKAHRDLVDDDRGASVCGVLWRLGRLLPLPHFQAVLHSALGTIPERLASGEERRKAGEGMCAALGTGGSGSGRGERRKFFAAAVGLAWRCRDNARRWRKQQQGQGGGN